MTPDELAQELRKRGLAILTVGKHPIQPEVLVVYLHGLAGQWPHGQARRKIAAVPDVVKVTDSASTPTILLAQMARSR